MIIKRYFATASSGMHPLGCVYHRESAPPRKHSCQTPKVTKARKILPVIFAARLTKPVRRAVASMSSEVKNSVHIATVLLVQAVMEVSLT